MELPICVVCDSTRTEIFKPSVGLGYSLIKCLECEVVFSFPFKAPSNDFYTNASDISSEQRHNELGSLPRKHPIRPKIIQLADKCKTVLDIGCGNGSFLAYASSHGFRGVGIDGDKRSIELARTRKLTNVEFYNYDIYRYCQEFDLKYDIVSMFEVFEHLDKPKEVIKIINDLLPSNGLFVGSLPNIHRWMMWDFHMNFELPPYHLTFWNIKSWTNFLNRNGFEIVYASNTNYYGYLTDYFHHQLMKKFKLRKNKLSNSIFALLKFGIETPLERTFVKGAGFIFIAKKTT